MTDRNPPGSVSVAGLGMVAALGPDVLTNCAAARAGIVRSSVIEGYQVRSAVDGAAEPVIGHQATLFTRGFEGETRLFRLAQGALSDLLIQTPHIAWPSERTLFYVSLPDAHRVYGGLDLIADAATRETRAQENADRRAATEDMPALSSARASRVLSQAANLARWPGAAVLRFATVAGQAGGAEAISKAIADLANGTATLAVVLAVDSWLDEGTLQWLQACGRLKCDGNPVGLQPGEAGAAIALRLGRRHDGGKVGVIVSTHFASESRSFMSGSSPVGEGLAEVVARAWDASPGTGVPWIVSDQNGEFYRASDWGHALVRLRGRFESFSDPVISFPALSFGDVGSAGALIGVIVAVRAWERDYAPASTAVVTTACDDAPRAALLISCSGPDQRR